MKISLICSQRNKKALLGSLAATGRLLSKARAELCSCHASQLAYVIWMITAGCSTVNAKETAVVMNLPSKPSDVPTSAPSL